MVFTRDERAKDMSHLEQVRFFRSFLTANIPSLVKDKKISFGPAISQGYESMAEYIDIYLTERMKFEDFVKIFAKARESGFEFINATSIPIFFPSIESSIEISEYEIFLEVFDERIIDVAIENNKKDEIIYEKIGKKGRIKKINIKNFIYDYSFDESEKKIILRIRHISGETIKPEIFLKLFFCYDGKIKKIVRKAFYWIDSKGNLNQL